MNLRYLLRAKKFRRKWDPSEIEWVIANVGPGATVFDIGANKGGWTYWMRKAVGTSGTVVAFEPQSALYHYLKGLYRGSYWKNVTLESVGLSNSNDTAEFFIPGRAGGNSPAASLKANVVAEEGEVQRESIQLSTMDAYCEKNGIGEIAFVKADVEGNELELLEGASNSLVKRTRNWIIESEARHIGEDGVMKLFRIMESAGYKGSFFFHSHILPLTDFSFEKHQNQSGDRFWDDPDYCNNFLFTR